MGAPASDPTGCAPTQHNTLPQEERGPQEASWCLESWAAAGDCCWSKERFSQKLIWEQADSSPVFFFWPRYCCSPWLPVRSSQGIGPVPLICGVEEAVSVRRGKEPTPCHLKLFQSKNQFSRECFVTHPKLPKESRELQKCNSVVSRAHDVHLNSDQCEP